MVPTLVGIAMVSAQRMLMWILTGAILAGLLHPVAKFFDKYIPHGLAVLVTMLLLWGTLGYAAYSVYDNLSSQARSLERTAPRLIKKYQRGTSSASRLAAKAQLDRRVHVFFSELPNRLRGGPSAKAIRGVATRAVSILVINVLAIFFMLHTANLTRGLLSIFPDQEQRRRWAHIVARTYERSFTYLRDSAAMALTAALVAYAIARSANVPSPFPLALFMGVFDLIPIFGVVLGGLPIVILSLPLSQNTAIVVLLVLIAYQVFEGLMLQPRVEERSVRPGPFISIIALFGGLEAFGVGGMFLSLVLAVIIVTFLDEVFPDSLRESLPEAKELEKSLLTE